MISNMDRYKKDLEKLIGKAVELENAMQSETLPKEWIVELKKVFKANAADPSTTPDDKQIAAKIATFIRGLPSFKVAYQPWYSEAMAVIKQILPDRLPDFVRHYEKPKSRKEISYENYQIEDYLQGLHVTSAGEEKVGPSAAIPRFRQQVAILKSCQIRFESSLFEIRQLVQADLFDSELEAAKYLSKHRFTRAAGAVAGVVLEKHLAQVCDNHSVRITKAKPTINDLNEALKAASVVEVPTWRFIQHLADIRNLCDHDKKKEPSQEQVDEMIEGVGKVSKTVF